MGILSGIQVYTGCGLTKEEMGVSFQEIVMLLAARRFNGLVINSVG